MKLQAQEVVVCWCRPQSRLIWFLNHRFCPWDHTVMSSWSCPEILTFEMMSHGNVSFCFRITSETLPSSTQLHSTTGHLRTKMETHWGVWVEPVSKSRPLETSGQPLVMSDMFRDGGILWLQTSGKYSDWHWSRNSQMLLTEKERESCLQSMLSVFTVSKESFYLHALVVD